MLVVENFPLHSRYIVLVPIHESFADLALFVDLGQDNRTIPATLPLFLSFYLLESLHVVPQVLRHIFLES